MNRLRVNKQGERVSSKIWGLSPETETSYESSISGHVFTSQIFEETSTLADQFQKAYSRVNIFPMSLQMISELLNPCG